MSEAINKISRGDDEVYEAIVATLQPGVLIVPSNAVATTDSSLQGVVVAGDAALNCIGVSSHLAVPNALQLAMQSGTDPVDGYPFVYSDGPGYEVTAYSHAILPMTYTASAVAFGAKLCAAVNGAVRAWVSGTDSPAAIVGYCTQPGGVPAAGGVYRAKILL
jgi:hypothetical protein